MNSARANRPTVTEVPTAEESALNPAALAKHPEIERVRLVTEAFPDDVVLAAPKVSVVVPARNEATNLPILFAKLPPSIFEVVLVDGNSSDDTIEVARQLRPDVRVVGQDRPGKGNALICGFNACRGDVIVMIDADGSMDAAEITSFVDALVDGADFVKGSRYMQGGGSSDITFLRSSGNHALRLMVNTIFGTDYSDLCYGYCAFWRDVLPELGLDCDGFEIETLMNVRAQRAQLRIAEVGSFESHRVHGVSNLHAVRDGWRVLKTIVSEAVDARVERPASIMGSELNSEAA
jgi:glycosyltransferase involved in cell wall biosynthesis